LFSLSYEVLDLAGCVLGALTPVEAEAVLDELARTTDCDAVYFGELPLDDALHAAAGSRASARKWRRSLASMVSDVHWVTELPSTFDEYMSQFSAKSRSTLRRKRKKLEAELAPRLEIVSRAEQVEGFLREGRTISQLTYQWDLGPKLEDDSETVERFRMLADEGELRCYLLHAGDRPIAFMQGVVVNGVYHYGTPGYLPEYAKWSPGTVLLLMVFEELIASGAAKSFDFGIGGDTTGYKSQFGNRSYPAARLELFGNRPRALFLYCLEAGLLMGKQLANRALADTELKARIKRSLRKTAPSTQD
jgi:hypothetical protein